MQVVFNLYIIYFFASRYKELDAFLWTVIFFGEATVSLNLGYLIILCKPSYVDYMVAQVIVIRAITTYVVFTMMKSNVAGFEDFDPKLLSDVAYIIALPVLLCYGHNWKIVLFFAAPTLYVQNYFTMKAAYRMGDDNLSCFKSPETLAKSQIIRMSGFIFFFLVAVYEIRRSRITLFIEKKKTRH